MLLTKSKDNYIVKLSYETGFIKISFIHLGSITLCGKPVYIFQECKTGFTSSNFMESNMYSMQ